VDANEPLETALLSGFFGFLLESEYVLVESYLSMSSISVPSGSSMKAINDPVGPSLKGSSVIVMFLLRRVEMVFSMSLISKAR